MAIFLLFVPVVYLAGNIFLYYRLLRAVAKLHLAAKIVISLLYWLLAAAMLLSVALRGAAVPEILLVCLSRVGSLWMIFMLYTAVMLLFFDVVRLLLPSFRAGLCCATCLTVLLLVYGNYVHRNPAVVPLDIVIEKPFAGDSLRIVVASDLHLGHGTGKGELRKYVDLINAQSADVVLFVGDLFDNSVQPARDGAFDDELRRLRAPQGIYMVPGNHEYISGYGECGAFLANTPVHLLRDDVVQLPCGVQLLLRDDRVNRSRLSLESFIKMADDSKPLVLLDHQPYYIAESNALGIDLHLSGHTHHGQSFPVNLITDLIFPQSHGYRKWSHSHVWVSSGLSLWGPPVRVGTRGDIAVITLRSGV